MLMKVWVSLTERVDGEMMRSLPVSNDSNGGGEIMIRSSVGELIIK